MRLTRVLLQQHIGWHFQTHWNIQRKRKVQISPVLKELEKKGVAIEDPNKFIREKVFRVRERVQVIKKPNPSSTNWHETPLLTYEDNNVLLEGLKQAKILTNTVEIQSGLPEKYVIEDISKELNRRVKKVILGSSVFDAEQQKLPKIKNYARPAFNYPRIYGITQERVFKLLISKLLNQIETSVDHSLVKQRYLADNLYFQFPFQHNEDLVQFQLLGDSVLLSEKPLSPITSNNGNETALPDIYPINPTLTLNKTNKYTIENLYPVNRQLPKCHPHTLFINFNTEFVKNLFEEKVTLQQIYGRTLMKAFTVAASYARAQFGEDVKKLPTPVTLQAVQTDGKQFFFGVLQLNTLDVTSSEVRNIWYQTSPLSLFDKCGYELGKPVLEGYNRSVVNHLVTFYQNT